MNIRRFNDYFYGACKGCPSPAIPRAAIPAAMPLKPEAAASTQVAATNFIGTVEQFGRSHTFRFRGAEAAFYNRD